MPAARHFFAAHFSGSHDAVRVEREEEDDLYGTTTDGRRKMPFREKRNEEMATREDQDGFQDATKRQRLHSLSVLSSRSMK